MESFPDIHTGFKVKQFLFLTVGLFVASHVAIAIVRTQVLYCQIRQVTDVSESWLVG